MATFFDRGRERAKHIVGRVSKAATTKKDGHATPQHSILESSEPAMVTSPSSRKSEPTALKNPLDDTDTLPVRDLHLSDSPRPFKNRDGDDPLTASPAGLPFHQSSNSYINTRIIPGGSHPWDIPLMSFVSAAKDMVPAASDAVNAPAPFADDQENLSAPDTPTNPAADAPAHVEVRLANTPATGGAIKQTPHNKAGTGTNKQATSACPSTAAASAQAPTATSSRTNRPGVADAANLIAPGLVAKRRAAAIAAVENDEGPSPDLQASPVIETEGAGEHKTGERVKLSAW